MLQEPVQQSALFLHTAEVLPQQVRVVKLHCSPTPQA